MICDGGKTIINDEIIIISKFEWRVYTIANLIVYFLLFSIEKYLHIDLNVQKQT